MSTLRGPVQLADLQEALCVPTNNLSKWRRRQTMGFLGRGFKSHIHHNKLFQSFPMSNLKKLSPVSPGNETAWILTGPPEYPADLLSRRFRGGECYKA